MVTGSFFWKHLLALHSTFTHLTQWEVGSGRRINVWNDNWMGSPVLQLFSKDAPPARRTLSLLQTKRQLPALLPRPFNRKMQEIIDKVTQIQLRDNRDKILWRASPSGTFSSKSAYDLMSSAGKINFHHSSAWTAKVPPSTRIFFVLLLKDKLLTQEVMIRRHLTITPGCVLCDSGTLETAQHLFVTCPVVGQIWCALSSRLNLRMLNPRESIGATYLASIPRGTRVQIETWRTYFICALWAVWRERNNRIFRQKTTPVLVIVDNIYTDGRMCSRYC
jgi:zinc-binding in reverse transcriptase